MTHTEPRRLRKLVVVTNSWHMPRARAIFSYVFSLPMTSPPKLPSPVHYLGTNLLPFLFGSGYHIEFEEAAAGISDPEILAARIQKEKAAAETFSASTKTAFDSMEAFHAWIFSQHMAYSSQRLTKTSDKGAPLTGEQALLMKTY
eukprot:gene20942-21686_t